MFIHYGEICLTKHHVQLLKKEPDYVKKRYHAVAVARSSKNNIIREKAAQGLKISMRQFQRLLHRFQEEGIPGLRHKSKRPHRSPNQTHTWLEDLVVKVREETGFGSFHISQIVNISLENQDKAERVIPRTVSRILVRRGVIESEKRAKKDWKRFEWGYPNQLIQADLTKFNGIPLLATEDDYFRRGWAIRLVNQKDKTVIRGMKKLLKVRYDNLLTDNGSQFREQFTEWCNEPKRGIDAIHAPPYYPQCKGKVERCIRNFNEEYIRLDKVFEVPQTLLEEYRDWYNKERYNMGINDCPANI